VGFDDWALSVEHADPIAVNPGMSDAWFDPATDGQGFFIVVFPDAGLIFLSWFTYDTERPPQDVTAVLGEPGHRWLTAPGPYQGNAAALDVYLTAGGVFDSAEPMAQTGDPMNEITNFRGEVVGEGRGASGDREIGEFIGAVGLRVRQARQRKGMSRRVLSERSGVSQRYLAQLESGSGNISQSSSSLRPPASCTSTLSHNPFRSLPISAP